MVLQLHKTLYGLKQSSRILNKALHGFFTLHSLQRGEEDHCVYFNASRTLFIMVYVDDLVLIGLHPAFAQEGHNPRWLLYLILSMLDQALLQHRIDSGNRGRGARGGSAD
jgi:hypothetical protein